MAARTAHPLILASASPRRRDLLANAGVRFEIRSADIPERRAPGEPPRDFAARLAREKALCVARRAGPSPPRWVLGADTIVVLDGDVLTKPSDPEHALALLSRLAGRRHCVVTAVALAESETLAVRPACAESLVWMRRSSEQELHDYVASGEPLDKAGAYGLQGAGRRLVERVEGSESTVIGLPLEETLALLDAVGVGRAA